MLKEKRSIMCIVLLRLYMFILIINLLILLFIRREERGETVQYFLICQGIKDRTPQSAYGRELYTRPWATVTESLRVITSWSVSFLRLLPGERERVFLPFSV